MPSVFNQCLWMIGEREWATGCPIRQAFVWEVILWDKGMRLFKVLDPALRFGSIIGRGQANDRDAVQAEAEDRAPQARPTGWRPLSFFAIPGAHGVAIAPIERHVVCFQRKT